MKKFGHEKKVTKIGKKIRSRKKSYKIMVKKFGHEKKITNIGQIIWSSKQYKELFYIFYIYEYKNYNKKTRINNK